MQAIVLNRLRNAISGDCWRTIGDFEIDVLHEANGVDQAFVKICRRLISQFLLKNQGKSYDGLCIQDMPSWYGKR